MKRKHAEAYQATSQDKKDADVTIWTDGSCVASQFGPGAWSFILKSDEKEIEASGYDHHTTVNRMEMMAAIEGLKQCPEGVAVLVISDSMLLVKCGSGEWKRKANLDLWSLLDKQMQNRSVVFRWVRGHNGDEMNERCDVLCGQARRNEAGTIRIKEIRQPKLNQELLDSMDSLADSRPVEEGRHQDSVVYVSVAIQIGNSDDKLSQREWSGFVREVRGEVSAAARNVHFFGCSSPDEQWQNACCVAEIAEQHFATLKKELTAIRVKYRQDSVAIIMGDVEFI